MLADAIGSADESVVVVEAEGAVAVAKEGALNTQIFDAAVCDICEAKIAVEGGEHGVDGAWGVAFSWRWARQARTFVLQSGHSFSQRAKRHRLRRYFSAVAALRSSWMSQSA